MNISEIELLTEKTVKPYVLEHMVIKDHDCYFCNFGEYFGYSIVVFKNGKHIYYANDYQLHHNYKVKEDGIESLRKFYINEMQHKLYTDSELLEPCDSYDEYELKNHFLRNYWIMRYDRLSIFGIGEDARKEFDRKKPEYPYYNAVCFCYVKDEKIVEDADQYIRSLENEFKKLKSNDETFRQMIRVELNNHEACITMDYTDALAALELKYSELSDEQKRIVKQELHRQIQLCN